MTQTSLPPIDYDKIKDRLYLMVQTASTAEIMHAEMFPADKGYHLPTWLEFEKCVYLFKLTTVMVIHTTRHGNKSYALPEELASCNGIMTMITLHFDDLQKKGDELRKLFDLKDMQQALVYCEKLNVLIDSSLDKVIVDLKKIYSPELANV